MRKGHWRAVRTKPKASWELYDLRSDPSEANNVAEAHPDVLGEMIALAKSAHKPVREGTFASTDRHQRDRRAKFGKHDDPDWNRGKRTKNRKAKQAKN